MIDHFGIEEPRAAVARADIAIRRTARRSIAGALLTGIVVAAMTVPAHAQKAIDKSLCASPPCPEMATPAHDSFFWGRDNYYMRDKEWVEMNKARLTVPKEGERVPELYMPMRSEAREWVEFGRKHGEDLAKLGIKVNAASMARQRMSSLLEHHTSGDIAMAESVMYPERVDPNEMIITRFAGGTENNVGESNSATADLLAAAQLATADPSKRLQVIRDVQKLVADNYAIALIAWGPNIIEAYNKDRLDNVRPISTFGIGSLSLPWNMVEATIKKGPKRINVGVRTLISNLNPFGTTALDRSVTRLLYDGFAQIDRNLNVVPGAAESWKRIDDRTYEIKLRPGMTFHDGKPVTAEDVKFTMDFMLKYDRGPYWNVNKFLDSTTIVDAAAGVVRFQFKESYGQFEGQFLLQNRIFPKHIWEGIMERQNITNPLQLQLKDSEIIGTGPFKWTGFYKKDTELLLAAHKQHYNAPKADELLLVVVPSDDGLLGRLAAGQLDMAANMFLRPSQADQLKTNPNIEIVESPDTNWLMHWLQISRMPWRDIEFRRAYMSALDRDFFVDVMWEGAGRIPTSNTIFPVGHPYNNPDLPPIDPFNLDKARDILKKAGYSWDREGRLIYPPPTDKEFIKRITQVTKNPGDWQGQVLSGQ